MSRGILLVLTLNQSRVWGQWWRHRRTWLEIIIHIVSERHVVCINNSRLPLHWPCVQWRTQHFTLVAQILLRLCIYPTGNDLLSCPSEVECMAIFGYKYIYTPLGTPLLVWLTINQPLAHCDPIVANWRQTSPHTASRGLSASAELLLNAKT